MAVHAQDVAADMMKCLPEEKIRICLFSMDRVTYAVPADVLTEIVIPPKIFPVPTAPSHVHGVINLRGIIIPIVDVGPILGLPRQSAPGRILIVKSGAMQLGIAVDDVASVITVPERSIRGAGQQPAAESLAPFLNGYVPHESGLTALLNIVRIIDEIRLK